MSAFTRVRSWLRRPHRHDHFALDGVAYRMLGDYQHAVASGDANLANILTGIAGCALAMSRTNEAMGWNPDPTPDEPSVAESSRLSGLLVLEISYCAVEGTGYREVRCRELDTETVAAALRALAVAYHAEAAGHLLTPTVGQCLSDLWHAVVEVIGGQAAESLVPLMIAHRYNPYACACPQCAGPACLPEDEQQRRAAVTEGCDQP